MPVLSKRDHQKFVGGFALCGILGSVRASMLPIASLSLRLWVIAVDPAFIAWHFYRSSKVQIEFLKFINCDNHALVGCIPIPAVHLNLQS